MTVVRSGQGHCRRHNKRNCYDGYGKLQRSTGYGMKYTGLRHRNWEKSQWKSKIGCGTGTGIYGEKRGALRRNNGDGNVRKRGRPKIRWLDGVRVIPKRRDCQGGSVRPSYI